MSARKIKSDTSYFYVTSADWEAVIDADCAEKAMVLAVEEMFNKFDRNFELAPVIIAIDASSAVSQKRDSGIEFDDFDEFDDFGAFDDFDESDDLAHLMILINLMITEFMILMVLMILLERFGRI